MIFKESERQPIELQRSVNTQDHTGGFVTSWTTVRSPIAEVMQRSRNTMFSDEAYSSEASYIFRFRVNNRTPNIDNSMRILYRNDIYQVESVKRIGRGLVDVEGIYVTGLPSTDVFWILEQGFWNKEGNWLSDGFWIKEPTA